VILDTIYAFPSFPAVYYAYRRSYRDVASRILYVLICVCRRIVRVRIVRAVYVNACLINCRIFIHFLVRLAFRPSGGAPNGPVLATTIASSSTTLAPTPRHQRLTTVCGWCDTIIQPFLSRFSAVSHPGVSIFRRFCDTKTPGWQNLVFWTQNQQRTHHKVGTARPPKGIPRAISATGACPCTHRAIDNRHTKFAGLSSWSFGSRRARIVCGGAPHTFCTAPAEVRAHPCRVDNDTGRAARRYC
jgi:hypothetical protein